MYGKRENWQTAEWSGSACSITKAASKMINDKISRDGFISSTIKL